MPLMDTALRRPEPGDIKAQIAEARKWLYPGATDYLRVRNAAVIEVLERVLREDLSDEEIFRLSYDYQRQEQVALGLGDTQGAVAPGAKHEALEYVRGHSEEPVEEF